MVADHLRLGGFLDAAETNVLDYMTVPSAHRLKLQTTGWASLGGPTTLVADASRWMRARG